MCSSSIATTIRKSANTRDSKTLGQLESGTDLNGPGCLTAKCLQRTIDTA